jgi:hypothetical protein
VKNKKAFNFFDISLARRGFGGFGVCLFISGWMEKIFFFLYKYMFLKINHLFRSFLFFFLRFMKFFPRKNIFLHPKSEPEKKSKANGEATSDQCEGEEREM